MPRVEICTSIAYSNTSIGETFLSDPPNLEKKIPIGAVLLHLIPTTTDTKLIIGYHETAANRVFEQVAALEKMSEENLLKAVSGILIKSSETWACSEQFYFSNIKPREKAVLHAMNYFVRRKQFSEEIPQINLFCPSDR